MKYLGVIILSLIIGCQLSETNHIYKGAFFGPEVPNQPQLLAPSILATPLSEYNGTFSPDGTLFYYTSESPGKSIITYTEMSANGLWSKPATALFSGMNTEYDPLFAPDGQRIYFSSERALNENRNNTNIWYVDIDDLKSPVSVPLTNRGNYYSSITNNGKIYFNVWNDGFIYSATPSDSGYVIEQIGIPEIDSDIGDPFIDPDETYLIYRGYGKKSLGRGDLFITYKNDNEWSVPKNLGDRINSEAHDICPYVTSDKKRFIFASDRLQQNYNSANVDSMQNKFISHDNGNQNIYQVSADFIELLKD